VVVRLLTDFAQDGLECGGAYMKLLKDNKALHAEEFSNTSPYVIMFGPDKCGATNKVSPKPM
jgi:calnexin